jgi:ABC-2 type transport system ATP-binding protein
MNQSLSEKRTILISTHILEEVEAVCTRAMIISEGKVVGYGTPDELMSQSMYRNSITVSVIGTDPKKLLEQFNEQKFIYSVERVPDRRNGIVTMRLYPEGKESIALQLEKFICAKKSPIENFNVNRGRLDEVFRELTSTK